MARLLEKEKYSLLFIPFTLANQAFFAHPFKMRYNHTLIDANYQDLYDAIFFIKEVSATKRLE